ncbi:MAG: gamma-mobile-trio protein GmtX [Proteobacteria bacterium]|nr:gamma-mobile-trio protein GmtX [Pseudomonadota bacterium]
MKMHPDDLLDQLKKTAGPRKQKTLDLIYEVCREQYERGSRDFSVATIARIAADRGGPSKGAIHNTTGDDYKGLIKAWAEHTGGVTSPNW